MKKFFSLLGIILVLGFIVGCTITPSFIPTEESETEYDVIYEDEE
jgi:hypothetical protein